MYTSNKSVIEAPSFQLYPRFCQAQLKLQLQLQLELRLALIPKSPTTHPPHPTGKVRFNSKRVIRLHLQIKHLNLNLTPNLNLNPNLHPNLNLNLNPN